MDMLRSRGAMEEERGGAAAAGGGVKSMLPLNDIDMRDPPPSPEAAEELFTRLGGACGGKRRYERRGQGERELDLAAQRAGDVIDWHHELAAVKTIAIPSR
jgi:hypothetical protein